MTSIGQFRKPALSELTPRLLSGGSASVSETTRQEFGIPLRDLWQHYFALGGMRSEAEIDQSLRIGTFPPGRDHDLLAHALNECLADLGRDACVEYSKADRRTAATRTRDARMELDLLGSFRLRRDGDTVRLARSGQRLVSFLALRDHFLQRQHVAGSLWNDVTDHQAGGSLRSTLWRLGDLAPALIEISDTRLLLAPTVTVDLQASERLADRILDPGQALGDDELDELPLSEDLLPDWTEEWVLDRRAQHAQLRVRALEALSRRLTELGRARSALHAAMLAVSVEPLRESAHRAVMTAYLGEGSHSAAAKQYETIRALLWDELGVEPSAETRALVIGLRA